MKFQSFIAFLKSALVVAPILFPGALKATGLREVSLPPIAPAERKVTVDGRLEEWKAIAGCRYNPLDWVVNAGGDDAIEKLLTDPVSATFKSSYDPEALYLAVSWQDRDLGKNTTPPHHAGRWFEGGEGFEVHLNTDRVLHLACWPSAKGKRLIVMARYDAQPEWKDVSGIVSSAGAFTEKRSGYAQELRIPWSAITAKGGMPGDGRIEMGIDFAWNAIPPSLVSRVRKAFWANGGAAPGVSCSFLTGRPGMAAMGYLPNPADWGTLHIGEASAANGVAGSSDGSTSLASLSVPLAKAAPSGGGIGWAPALFRTSNYLGALWGGRFSCQVAAQYDVENLHLRVHFAGPGPSNLKAESTQQGYGGGDAVQIRLSNGGKKVSLCGWYDSAAREPALTADSKELPNPFLLKQGAKESFQADPKGGYIQELALPWKLLFGGAPKSGDKLQATLQFWYADLSPRFSLHAKAVLERQGALSVPYRMPADGQLTLGLFDQGGGLLKWLAQDTFRYAGQNRQVWDGLDQWGKPVPPGRYVLKAIYHAPITTDYKMSVCNPGNPPWPTPDDKGDWLGDEANPQAAVTDGQWVFLAAPGCELGYSVMAVDEKGQRQWGVREMFSPRSVSMALDGDFLYVLYSGPERFGQGPNLFTGDNAVGRAVLICLDKRTGQPARFTRDHPRLKVAEWPYREEIAWLADLRNRKSFTPANYGGQPRYSCVDIGESTNAIGIAAAGGKLYASLIYDHKLLVLDAATGKPTGEEIPLHAPAGLHPLDAKTLLAVSGTQVVKVDLTSKAVTPLITSNLAAPDSITTDKQGNLYVSDWGASFQVKAFDPAGRFLHAIGKEGGRPWVGPWNAEGMLVPRGIAVTDEGKLWVAEDDGSPKRISVWDSKSGAFLKDYIGPTPYGGGTFFWIDPKDPARVHTEGTRFKVDPAAKTYTPEAITFRRQGRDDPFTPVGHNLNDIQVRVLYRDGHEYLFISNVQRLTTAILQRKGDVYRPVAAYGGLFMGEGSVKSDGTAIMEWDSDIGYHVYNGFFPECFKGHQGDNYTWTDGNGDNLVQPEEMRWMKTGRGAGDAQGPMDRLWNGDISSDWRCFFVTRRDGKQQICSLAPRGWTDAGAPIYEIADAKTIFSVPDSYMINSLHATSDNKLIVCYNFEQWGKSPDTVGCYDFEGRRLWSIARTDAWTEPTAQSTMVHANGAIYDFKLPKLGDVFGTWLYHGSRKPFLVTTDGLYVGTMMENTMLGPTSLRGESACYYYQAPNGTPYIINGANQAEHIFEIKGLEPDSAGRFEASYQLSEAEVKKAAGMRAVPEVKPPPKPLLGVSWLQQPPALDGGLGDWEMKRGVALDGGSGRTAEIALGRDERNLYLACRVGERNPMRNGGADWQTLFITGDCVDLMLQSDSKADSRRRNPAVGDQRLLFTLFQDKPIAVLYRPVVPGTASPVPMASARIDRVIRLDSAKVVIRRDSEHRSYTVEASVPLADLGINPKETGELRGDVGVIFADESGKGRSLRLYYYNKQTQMVSDLATEATLQPDQWGPVAMPLGLNLIKNGGFEEPLVDSREAADKGWYVGTAENGSEAVVSAQSPHTGRQSLLMQTPVPVIFPPEAYKEPDYSNFVKSANGGKGGGEVMVAQRVPVMPGHEYSLRYRYRGEEFQPERRQPGHPRGFILFQGRLDWACTPPNRAPGIAVGEQRESTPEWQTVKDFYNTPWLLGKTYKAPEGATHAVLAFRLRTVAADRSPRLFLDDVEFVDVTPSTAAP